MRFEIITLVLILSSQLFSQVKLESIALGSDLSYGLKGINYVNKATGFGFSGELKFKLDQRSKWKFGFISGYRDLKIEPSDSMTIERWNWDYWRIWYRSHVRSLIADSNYAVNLNPEQRLYVLPVKIYFGRDFSFGKFTFLTGFVLGLTFYERAFWLNETWWKRFPNVSGGETYVFQYSFKNNAPSKKGTVLNLGVKFEAGFRLTKIASFTFGFEFEHYPSINKIERVEFGKIVLGGVGESYKNFVLRDVFKLTAGFAFNY
ncbi:MAG: hypothetical protein N2252_01325 [Candidatus Kryptonium sp.]|nr:hypothetical protein [Candidatus Kryptonium sp.]